MAAAQESQLNSQTRLYGVIGNPIAHSKSPLMLNRAFQETGINAAYLAFHIMEENLASFVEGARAMGMGGFNVTIPHKVAIMPLLDEIDPHARDIGAVNTVVNQGGKLIGFNTDGIGYVRSLREETGAPVTGQRIVVIGAGGAARGIAYALAKLGPERIVIANRSLDKAEDLASVISGHAPSAALATSELAEACAQADVVINTTSIGMHPAVDATPVEAAWLKPQTVASDLIYNPLTTRFLREAKDRGCLIHGGLGMFVYQGAYAFEYWHKQDAPVKAMRAAVLAALEG